MVHQTCVTKAKATRKNVDIRPSAGLCIEAADVAAAADALALGDAPELDLDTVEVEPVDEVVIREDDEDWVGVVVALDTDMVTVLESVLIEMGLALLVKEEGMATDDVRDATGESKEPVMPVNLMSS